MHQFFSYYTYKPQYLTIFLIFAMISLQLMTNKGFFMNLS